MSVVQVVEQSRGPGIGASIAAECLGMSPYGSPVGAWLKLLGRAKDTSSAASEWGQILEPVVRGYYAARHGFDKPGQIEIVVPTASMYHPELPWLRATPDGIVREWVESLWPRDIVPGEGMFFDRHLVQVKTVTERLRWHWGLDKKRPTAPPHYRVQAVVEMAVTGIPRVDFAVLCGKDDYFEVTIKRDAELENMILERLTAFWALMQRDEPPEIDDADEWRAYFADRLPRQRVEAIAHGNAARWIEAWKDAHDRRAQAESDEMLAKNHILAAAVEARATVLKSDHGDVLVVQPKDKKPYLRAPDSWAVDKDDAS